jgi:hypothetical protein
MPKKLVAAILFCTGAFLLTGCQAQPPSELDDSTAALTLARPASVPLHYVPTPNGWFHPGCVVEVADDERIRDDGEVEGPGGVVRPHAPCGDTPRYDMRGELIDESGPKPTPSLTGWLESASSTAVGAVSYVHAQWNVPHVPSSNAGHWIYYFPGLEDINDVKSILQPVLSWNLPTRGKWGLASWNCCVKGTTFHTAYLTATAGGTVSADIGGTNCGSNGVCANWQVVSLDWTTELSKTLNTTSFGVPLNWIFGGVLEVDASTPVSSCSEFPSDSVTFSDFYINKANGTHVATPSWSSSVRQNPSPACSFSITYPGGGKVTLHE